MYGNIDGLCKESNKQRFTCNGAKVVYQASIIWGAVGPQRMFQNGQVYSSLMYFFLIGVSCCFSALRASGTDLYVSQPVVTVLVYLAYRRWPTSFIKYINVPIFFNSAGSIPPATVSEFYP